MSELRDIPEIAGLDARRALVRIPPEWDVPLTDRVRRLIDTPQFRRLSQISQVGLVSLVYPAARHTRFEHSLGVYRLALLYLKQLSYDERFAAAISPADAERFIAAALLHDLGHWPYCHPIEDLRLKGVPRHEALASRFLAGSEIGSVLRAHWRLEPSDVDWMLNGEARDLSSRILCSLLSGPIDVDKLDYLQRDSLHCGVPYGRHFDQQRLVGSLCLNEAGDGLAITDKGKTAAEMLIFARYIMFSEVYWHHAVRAATAMFQRAFYLLHQSLELESLFWLADEAMIDRLRQAANGRPEQALLEGLFGASRRLYKRVAQYSYFQCRELYQQLARRPYPWLAECGRLLTERIGSAIGRAIEPNEILIDAPPVKREIEFRVDIQFPKESRYRSLAEVSPVVRTLAMEQFDDYVKRVRVFAHERIAGELRALANFDDLLQKAVSGTADRP